MPTASTTLQIEILFGSNLSGTCRVSLWGELFRSGNDQITVLQLVGFAQQEVAEKLLKGGKIRLNAAGIVAIVGTHKGIAEVPGVFGQEVVADGEAHCPEIFDRKDCRGSGVAFTEWVDLPDTGNKLGKVTDHLGVIEILVAELLFIVKVVLQSPLDFRSAIC